MSIKIQVAEGLNLRLAFTDAFAVFRFVEYADVLLSMHQSEVKSLISKSLSDVNPYFMAYFNKLSDYDLSNLVDNSAVVIEY